MAVKQIQAKHTEPGNAERVINDITAWLVSIMLVATAVLPDAKVVRLKLQGFEIAVFCIFVLWLAASLFAGRLKLKKGLFNLPVVLYAGVFTLFYILTPDKHIAQQEFRRVLLCAGILLPIANSFSGIADIKKVFFALLVSVFTGSLYGILQYFGGLSVVGLFTGWYLLWAAFFVYAYVTKVKLKLPVFYVFGAFSAVMHLAAKFYGIAQIDVPYMDRPMSTFGNPIFFAAYLILLIPIVISYCAASKNRIMKFISFVAGLAMLTAVFLAKTRAAWLGLGVGMTLWIFLFEHNRGWKLSKYLISNIKIIGIVVVMLSAGHFFLRAFSSPYGRMLGSGKAYFTGIINRQQAHLLIWRDSIKMWQANPVAGVGLGGFYTNFPKYASEELKAVWPQGRFIVNDAHNEYLQLLTETGILGFGVFMILIVSVFIQTIRIWKKSNSEERIYLAGFAAGSAALLTQNIFSVDMRFAVSSAYLFFVFGLIGGLEKDAVVAEFKKSIFLRVLLAAMTAAGGVYLFRNMIKPYRAYYALKQEKDFFDDKVLEPAKTIEELSVLLNKHPDEPKIHEKLGWVYAKEKDWNMAIKHYEKARELNPRLVGAYNNLGNIYFHLNNRDKAIEFYRMAVSIEPNTIDAWLNMGIAYYNKGMLKEAADALKEALKIDPNNSKAIAALKRMSE